MKKQECLNRYASAKRSIVGLLSFLGIANFFLVLVLLNIPRDAERYTAIFTVSVAFINLLAMILTFKNDIISKFFGIRCEKCGESLRMADYSKIIEANLCPECHKPLYDE